MIKMFTGILRRPAFCAEHDVQIREPGVGLSELTVGYLSLIEGLAQQLHRTLQVLLNVKGLPEFFTVFAHSSVLHMADNTAMVADRAFPLVRSSSVVTLTGNAAGLNQPSGACDRSVL